MRAFLQLFFNFCESRMSAGKLTIVQCLSHMRRQFERGTGAMLLARRCGRPTERQARTDAGSYASAHTNELKDKRGYLDMGWGTQPQQY